MDLGGRTSVDLTEAARLMKQSTSTPTGTNPAQLQTPPLIVMQQAVAMQQFQFQQALLMQQVMATQQAAARAATVKSAAEMAAARAAEISKQLKGPDAEEEEKKPTSPERSKSRSPSRSRSASRSKSRSPIRYRRDRSRSLSRSPIRYRRDRPYSPSRSRDHYSYRSRSRRGYYRGRGDYPWNPYRREWDRERDRDYYARSRRSRSRSRSRVRRRSRSRSRSPRFRRERSISPRHRRDDRKPSRSVRRSRSKELKRTPSVSSRSPSPSPHRKVGSRSPSKQQPGSGISPVLRGASGSPVPQVGRRPGENLSPTTDENDQIRSPDHKARDDRRELKGPSLDTDSFKDVELQKVEPSVSPRRSASVSFNHSLRKDLQSDDDEDVNSNSKRNVNSRVPPKGDDGKGVVQADLVSITPDFPSQVPKPKGSGSDISSEGGNVEFKAKDQFLEKQSRPTRRGERSSKDVELLAGQESDDGKGLDDWRDDMKAHSKEKSRRKDERKAHDRKSEDDSRFSKAEITTVLDRSRVDSVLQGSWDTSRSSKKHALGDSDVENEQQEADAGRARKGRISSRDKARSSYEVKYEVVSEVKEIRGAKHADKEYKEPGKERAVDIVNEDKKELEDLEETIFEGPKLEPEEYEVLVESVRPSKRDEYKNVQRGVDQVASAHPRARDDSDVEDEEELKVMRIKGPSVEDDVVVGRKGKEKSRSKDRRLDDDEERERRKERHRKHKKKHRREPEDDKDEGEEDHEENDGRKERRRHKRKHRKEDDDERRERKKKKHKSRGKSGSDSAGESSRADGKDEDDGSPDIHNMLGRCNTGEECPDKGLGLLLRIGWLGWPNLCFELFCFAGRFRTVAKHTVSVVRTPLTIGQLRDAISVTASHCGAAKIVYKCGCVLMLGRRPLTRTIIFQAMPPLLHKCRVLEMSTCDWYVLLDKWNLLIIDLVHESNTREVREFPTGCLSMASSVDCW